MDKIEEYITKQLHSLNTCTMFMDLEFSLSFAKIDVKLMVLPFNIIGLTQHSMEKLKQKKHAMETKQSTKAKHNLTIKVIITSLALTYD